MWQKCDKNEYRNRTAIDVPVTFCFANQHYLKEMLQVNFDFF